MATNSAVATLYQEVEQLDNGSLDTFINDIFKLYVRRKQTDRQREEAILLKKINKSLSVEQIQRFRSLKDKNTEGGISELEYAELLILLEKIEKLTVNRLKYLTQLARLRNVSVRELMNQLGISNPTNE